jgi:hypothetical protein
MRLGLTTEGVFVAITKYGEWAAKHAGFTWNKERRWWETSEVPKATALKLATGLDYQPFFKTKLEAEAAPAAGDQWPTIPAGRYAVADSIDGVLKFYQIDKPKEGRWQGFTFLKVFASDTTYPIKDYARKTQLLNLIAKNPTEAMKRYGQEIGTCGCCGRQLTDAESRAYGIGPICRVKLGC